MLLGSAGTECRRDFRSILEHFVLYSMVWIGMQMTRLPCLLHQGTASGVRKEGRLSACAACISLGILPHMCRGERFSALVQHGVCRPT